MKKRHIQKQSQTIELGEARYMCSWFEALQPASHRNFKLKLFHPIMAEKVQRVDAATLQKYTGQVVRIVGKAQVVNASEGTVVFESNGTVKLLVPPNISLEEHLYFEVTGKVTDDLSVRVLDSILLGNSLSKYAWLRRRVLILFIGYIFASVAICLTKNHPRPTLTRRKSINSFSTICPKVP